MAFYGVGYPKNKGSARRTVVTLRCMYLIPPHSSVSVGSRIASVCVVCGFPALVDIAVPLGGLHGFAPHQYIRPTEAVWWYATRFFG